MRGHPWIEWAITFVGGRAQTANSSKEQSIDQLGKRSQDTPASSKAALITSDEGALRYGSIAWKESQPPTAITTRGVI